MDDKERKRIFDEIYKHLLVALTHDIERARKENRETKKMQDFVIEKITVEIAFKSRYPKSDWIAEGIDHYIKLGIKTSRNDILTKLTGEMARLREINDPKEIEEIVKKYKEHEKEILDLVKPHIIEVMKPRF